MHGSSAALVKLGYLARVLFGLALLMLWVGVALWLPAVAISPPEREIAIGLLALGMLLLLPLVYWLNGRADELQRSIHQLACTRSLPWLAAACGVLGVLQANDLLPAFNQFWMLGLLVAMWGVQLMRADRPYH